MKVERDQANVNSKDATPIATLFTYNPAVIYKEAT